MVGPDLDRERSEEKRTQADFLAAYNTGLPPQFPRASASLLAVFKAAYPALFKNDGLWSLDTHRKKVMDWLPSYLKSTEKATSQA